MTVSAEQLELALGPFQNRRLFAHHFLLERLPQWSEFDPARHASLRARLAALWERERALLPSANEAQTEERFIRPVLEELGFVFTVQADVRTASGRRQPDYALFLSDTHRLQAERGEGAARYQHAIAVADAKRFSRALDGRETGGQLTEDPVAQIINYVSITKRRWGLLTNGRLWRLYAAEGDLIEGACYEVDLTALLDRDDGALFGYFGALFDASAFAPDANGRCLLDRALADSRGNAVELGDRLERQVFAAVPALADGLLGGDERTSDSLQRAFDHALVVLYRLLFCLYAEARGLLPIDNVHYRPHSLLQQRDELAAHIDRGRVFSAHSDDLYGDLRALFSIVDLGDPDLGVNEYDGGLFSGAGYPWLAGRSVPDRLLAPAVDGLYRVGGQSVDYRDLSPRHLGSIYERLLDYRLVAGDGGLALEPADGRRESGSYYTPSHVVDAIVEASLEPLLQRRSEANAALGMTGDEALEAFLELRVLDPAMGSGHFLVAAAAYIAQFAATDPSYDGDLELAEILRRVAERCIYGVDLNPMAVELARLSLWLTTVSEHAPLTFLANLRVGNSLVGADLHELLAGEGSLFAERIGRDASELLARIDEIRNRESRLGDDVHAKERLAAEAAELRAPLEVLADQSVTGIERDEADGFLHWALEFPEVFLSIDGRPRDDGGFDAVVGNPPYVRIQALGRELASYCRDRYETASGSFDVYVPFLERSASLLATGGRLGFIVPNKFLKLDYGRGLRGLFARKRLVEEIIDFGDAQVFEGATNYTCILLLDDRGADELTYRRVRGGPDEVRTALVATETLPTSTFAVGGLGADPWVMATGEEAAILRVASAGSERLDDVTSLIFTGLQTSADPVYVLEDRGRRGTNRLVWSRASGAELELEDDLLRPLASGSDTERYAFSPLRSLLLFPYERVDGEMRLISTERLSRLPLTAGYLAAHEEALRGREHGRMDHQRWYAYVYPKSLGAHDHVKLGVAATVRRLEIAADLEGETYFHNVRVNGIHGRPDGPSLAILLALLNARLLDYIFRRGAAEHAGGHYAANKQFIAPLPIRVPSGAAAAQLDRHGELLHDRAAALGLERRGFLDWLGGVVGTRIGDLAGATKLAAYDQISFQEVFATLDANHARLARDPRSRALREHIEQEWEASIDRLRPLGSELARAEAEVEDIVFDLYELSASQRGLVDAEYQGQA